MPEDDEILEINKWITPATQYPIKTVNDVSIERIRQNPGFYYMEGVRGYFYYENIKKIPVTCLKIGREVVMVDDPLHWYGMQDLANNCCGNVLIAGLGLGLILHGLQSNNRVTGITVIERNPNVLKLMKHNIPKDERIRIILDDFWGYIECHLMEYDTVLLDIWWGNRNRGMHLQMIALMAKVGILNPNAKIMVWGMRDPEVNPAVMRKVNY